VIKTYPKHTIQPIFSYQNLIKSFISSKGVSDLNLYHSGSAALFSGLQTLIAQKNIKNIFIPKFICKEVVEVVKKCNINIDYYDVDLDLNIDSNNNFKKNMSVNSVILIVNYFGFSTNWNLIQHLKETYGCLVVEDNCHILDSNRKADILSKSADLSFNSLRKVLPVLSGSILKSNNPTIIFNNKSMTTFPNFKEILYSLRGFKKSKRHPKGTKNDHVVNFNEERLSIDYFSYKIIMSDVLDIKKISSLRIDNYHIWHEFLFNKGLELFSRSMIDQTTSPYVFPCMANSLDEATKWIEWGRNKNINIIKWPDFPIDINMNDIPKSLRNVLLFPVNDQHRLDIDTLNMDI